MVNNNIIHINNHLLLWHKEGNNKLNSNCAFRYSTTGSHSQSLRIEPSNQRLEFVFLHQRGRWWEAGCRFVIHRLRFLIFRKGVVYLVLALLSSNNYIIIIYCLNLLTSRCPNRDLSFLQRQCAPESNIVFTCCCILSAKLEH